MDERKIVEAERKEPVPVGPYMKFCVEFVVGDRAFRIFVDALSQEEAAHHALFVVCTQWPAVRGYNILSADQTTILEHFEVGDHMVRLFQTIQQISGLQLRTMVPVHRAKAEGEDIQKLYEQAKKDGRTL